MTAKIGDRVRFLNSTGGGIVRKIADGIAHVEDEDGFVTPVLLREVVVVVPGDAEKIAKAEEAPGHTAAAHTETPVRQEPAEELEPFEETPEGEKINLVLAFAPSDLKKLGQGSWESFLINDSNYWISFVMMGKGPAEQWELKTAKTIEPGTQLFLEEIYPDDLQSLERLKFQCMAYKTDKPFTAKAPFDFVEKIDDTKFFKLHCYRPSVYFDEPVLSVELIKDDAVPGAQVVHDMKRLEEEMNRKKLEDQRPVVRKIKKRSIESDPMAPIIVDLHIEELVDNIRGMKAADILNRQVDEFRSVMDANKGRKGKKIIFIHGKGEGILKNALMKELNHSYKGNDVQDASFREYGFGATQVTIR